MNTVMLELPIDALALPGVSPEELAREAKFMLALKLFEVGRWIACLLVPKLRLGNAVLEASASRGSGKQELAELGSQRGRWEPAHGGAGRVG